MFVSWVFNFSFWWCSSSKKDECAWLVLLVRGIVGRFTALLTLFWRSWWLTFENQLFWSGKSHKLMKIFSWAEFPPNMFSIWIWNLKFLIKRNNISFQFIQKQKKNNPKTDYTEAHLTENDTLKTEKNPSILVINFLIFSICISFPDKRTSDQI